MSDFWLNKDRQLIASLTANPVHVKITFFERPGGFRDTLFLKKKEVEWLSEKLAEFAKDMKE